MNRIFALMLAFGLIASAFGQNGPSSMSLSAAEKALKAKDYPAALAILKPLAEQGNSEAQAHLGLMYELGRGVEIDFGEAFRFYRSAAERGVVWAQPNLGLAYANGRGVEKNDQEATKWFRRAALKGNTFAQKMLVRMYEEKRGTPLGRSEVVNWINPSNLMYISGLQRDFGRNIHFESSSAEKIVREFSMDCKGTNRYLPLMNVLLARLASVNENGTTTNVYIKERAGEVRIIDSFVVPDGRVVETVSFQINKWGELTPMGGITTTAVLNACFGSYGPIWLLE